MSKALNICKTVITYAVIAIAVCMMIFTVISVSTFDRMDRSIFGYKAFMVLTDSMSATDFSAGDLVLSREVDPSTLAEGDIITFQSTNPESYGEIITHKIRSLTTDADGNPGFITYGTTTDTDDSTVVTYNFVIGKYQTKLPGVGKFFQFLKTTPGYIVCILIPFLALILMQGINTVRLFLRYRQEQLEELNAEKAKIEEERLASQRMMQELLELKAKLDGQVTAPSAHTPTDAPTAPPAETTMSSAEAGETNSQPQAPRVRRAARAVRREPTEPNE